MNAEKFTWMILFCLVWNTIFLLVIYCFRGRWEMFPMSWMTAMVVAFLVSLMASIK